MELWRSSMSKCSWQEVTAVPQLYQQENKKNRPCGSSQGWRKLPSEQVVARQCLKPVFSLASFWAAQTVSLSHLLTGPTNRALARSLHAGVLEKKGTFLAERWEITKSCLLPFVALGLSHGDAWKLENNSAAEFCNFTAGLLKCTVSGQVMLPYLTTTKTMHKISKEQWKYFKPTFSYFSKTNAHTILYVSMFLCMHIDFFSFLKEKNKHQHSRLACKVATWKHNTRIKRQTAEVIQKPLSKYLPSFTHGNWSAKIFLTLLLLNPKIKIWLYLDRTANTRIDKTSL